MEWDGYPPLREYAMVGDMRTVALVARDGSVDWFCLPCFDGPAALCRLLDERQGGWFRVGPVGRFHATRRYQGDTAVLVTDFETAQGRVRLTDFMPLAGDGRGPRLLRLVEGLAGSVDVEVVLRPGFDYARAPARLEGHGRIAVARGGGQSLELRTPAPLKEGPDGRLTARLRVRAGQRQWVTLTTGDGQPAASPTDAEAEAALVRTLRAWERWVGAGEFAGPYAPALRRSAITLKLLIHQPSGAFVAAPTTSLPECTCGTRNWDYRYAWLRDSAWVMDALMSLGYQEEAGAFLGWMESLGLDEHPPKVVYRVEGGPTGDEECLTHLDGYAGAQPVRVGNVQTSEERHPMRLGAWRMVRALATRAARSWREPDSGMWEQRIPPRHYVSSKLMCWVAVDRALLLSERYGLDGGPLAEWRAARDELRAVLETRGYDVRVGAFTHALGEPELDASALLMASHGFLSAEDPRVLSTLARVREQLAVGPLVYRYRHPDGLPGHEGAFTPCGFWVVDALALAGRLEEAHCLYEQLLGYANDVGLLSEELDPETGRFLGNFPQGLAHLSLIRTGLLLARLTGHSNRCALIDSRCTKAYLPQGSAHV